MSWKTVPDYTDNRRLLEIPAEDVSKRIGDIINSNPIVNGSINSTDGNSRQMKKSVSKIKIEIKKRIKQDYKNNISVVANRLWADFQNAITKLITDFLIQENYKFYLQDQTINNQYTIEKGGIWFLPTYFCLRVNKFKQGINIEFFSNADRNYYEKEFYCETSVNMRHPCLTIEVEPSNRIFWVLICSNASYFGRNEPITLKKSNSDYEQFVALDWKVQASRKMLDIKNTKAFRFGISEEELTRIEGRMMLRN